MVRHHQRPRGERHEFPRPQEGESVIRQNYQIHPRKERREKRQHALRLGLVPTVANAVETCCRASQIDNEEEERSKRIQSEMGAEPRQSERQRQIHSDKSAANKVDQDSGEKQGRACRRRTVNDGRRPVRPDNGDSQHGCSQQCGDQPHEERHDRHQARARIPRAASAASLFPW